MTPQSPRHRETKELISRLQARRARKRRLRLLLAAAAVAVLVILAVVAVAALSGAADEQAVSSSAPLTTSATTAPAGASGGSSSPTTTTTATPSSHSNTTTSRPSTTETSIPPTTSSSVSAKVVVIDPGHQARPDLDLEPIGPGSDREKAKVSSGTSGVVTGIPESELNLAIGLKLRDALEAKGIKVVMTRTTQEVDLSNRERARIANEAKADLFIRIHADGNTDHTVHGIHTLYPASIPGWTDDIAAVSKKAAQLVQRELIKATGARDRGLNERSDLTGFNWSDVPVVLPEIGYMTNPTEDRLLATDSYRDKIVQGLVRAILEFLGMG
jgi:N-acetylmuramoyl-L-alanine amidase